MLGMEKLSPLSGGVRSYSDFMRSLAAKYNNNQYLPPSTERSSSPPPSQVKSETSPLLGLPYSFPGFALPGVTGFHPFLPPTQDTAPMPLPDTVAAKRSREDPLDLTEKRVKVEKDGEGDSMSCGSVSPPSSPRGAASVSNQSREGEEAMRSWSVDQVASWVGELDMCGEYQQVFREHRIDGSCLTMLTIPHLTSQLGMKLGPAMKLVTALKKELGNVSEQRCSECAHCHAQPNVDRR